MVRLVGEQADDGFEAFVERVEAVGERGVDVDAVGAGLFLVPPAPRPSSRRPLLTMSSVAAMLASTAGWRYGMPVTSTPTRKRRVACGERGGDRPPFEAVAGGVGEDRVEVVEGPARLVEVDLVGGLPDLEHVAPRGVLRGGLEAEPHAVAGYPGDRDGPTVRFGGRGKKPLVRAT